MRAAFLINATSDSSLITRIAASRPEQGCSRFSPPRPIAAPMAARSPSVIVSACTEQTLMASSLKSCAMACVIVPLRMTMSASGAMGSSSSW
jgi:hypothetical protein